MEGVVALFIPIVGILIVPLIVWVVSRADTQQKLEIQKTIRTMAENGQPVSSELMEKMMTAKEVIPEMKREKDFSWGVIFVALGFGIFLFGVFSEGLGSTARTLDNGMVINGWQDVWEYAGIASILLTLGLARLALWKFAVQKNSSS